MRTMAWVLMLGERFARAISPYLERLTTRKLYRFVTLYRYLTWPGNTPITRPLGWLFSKRISRPFLAVVFRHPTLVFLLSVDCFFLERKNHLVAASVLLLVAIWIEPLNRLLHRYKLGTIDNYLVAFSLRIIDDKLIFPVSRRLFLRRFILLHIGLFFISVVGYAAIYSNFASGMAKGNGLSNLESLCANPLWVQCLYFSVSTFCTVGFGDVTTTGPLAQLVAITEICLGFVLLVMLLSAFSLSSGQAEEF